MPAETVATLREDLNDVLRDEPPRTVGSQIQLHPRMFESSAANLSLSDMEPIVCFAEALVEPTCDVEGFDELDVDCWFRGDPAPTIWQVAGHCRRINEVDTTLPVIINANGRLMDGGQASASPARRTQDDPRSSVRGNARARPDRRVGLIIEDKPPRHPALAI